MYDELFHTVTGELAKEVFDPDLWNILLALEGLEKADDRTDVRGDHVPFDDYFDEFNHADPDPDPGPLLPGLPGPEGGDGFDDSDTDTVEPSSPEGAPASEGGPDPYITRSGRRIVKPTPYTAATAAAYVPKQSRSNNRPSYELKQYLAGGNLSSKTTNLQHYHHFMASLDWEPTMSKLNTATGRRALVELAKNYDFESETQEDWDPMALGAKAADSDPDTFTYQEAMNHPDADGFMDAAKTEIETLHKMKVWDEVDRQPWMNVLPGTWTFRLKRYPSGLIRKFKARFCARGDRQIQGVDFFETYSPVVSWNTVRLMLVLSLELGLVSKQVDYMAAFVHAPLEKPPGYDEMTPQEQA
ncbi:MAG: hypothetical protein LC687_07920, partial [Actinobacteria bacterium]|nr:hypothetical protein [Actinomycetota bacterium]